MLLLFRVLSLFGCVLGPTSTVLADDEESKSAAAIEKLGGSITRDMKTPGKPVVGVRFDLTPTNANVRLLSSFKLLTSFKNLTTLTVVGPPLKPVELTELP